MMTAIFYYDVGVPSIVNTHALVSFTKAIIGTLGTIA